MSSSLNTASSVASGSKTVVLPSFEAVMNSESIEYSCELFEEKINTPHHEKTRPSDGLDTHNDPSPRGAEKRRSFTINLITTPKQTIGNFVERAKLNRLTGKAAKKQEDERLMDLREFIMRNNEFYDQWTRNSAKKSMLKKINVHRLSWGSV